MTTLSNTSINWAIEHLARYCDTDIFPKAFEFEAISFNKDETIKLLSKQDICQWSTRPLRRCLVPKNKYGFRIATQLDPLDMLFFTALIYETGEDIELSRIPLAEKISLSSRFGPNNIDFFFFSRNTGYSDYQQHSRELAEKYEYVVCTDIADFYPRIYLHRLETAVQSAIKSQASHVTAIIQLIKSWNHNVSYGIPVGNNPSRLLAELVIDDVDRILLAEKIIFTRFVDDYRLFCKSEQDAYKCLARLANVLYENHGLTLQAQKTKILPSERFFAEVLDTEERKEIEALASNFGEIISSLGLDNPYEPINYFELESETRQQIDALNLEDLLGKQIASDEIDISLTRFLINRLGQLRRTKVIRLLLHNSDKLYPVFPEIISYLAHLTNDLQPDVRGRIGAFLLEKLDGSVISHLEFHKMLIMSLFAGSTKWGNARSLPELYSLVPDNWFRRTLLLAIGKADLSYWIRSKKFEMEQMPPWEKRAFLYASSCLPKDEKENYFRAIKTKMDNLEKTIISWAHKNPINSN